MGSQATLQDHPEQLHFQNQFHVSMTAEFLGLEKSSSLSPHSMTKSSLHHPLHVASKPTWLLVVTGSSLLNLIVDYNYHY